VPMMGWPEPSTTSDQSLAVGECRKRPVTTAPARGDGRAGAEFDHPQPALELQFLVFEMAFLAERPALLADETLRPQQALKSGLRICPTRLIRC
jgi:hypothetical protein